MTRRATPAVATLPVGSPKSDRSKGRSQMKRDTLALQVGGLGIRPATLSRKKIKTAKNAQLLKAIQMNNRRPEREDIEKDIWPNTGGKRRVETQNK